MTSPPKLFAGYMRIAACAVLSTLLVWPVAAETQAIAEVFARGNEAYESGDFAAASRHYAQCVGLGATGADVLYNLGTAHARSARTGEALAAYWAARRIAPRDPDLLANAERLAALRADSTPQIPRSWLMAVAGGVVQRLTVNELASVALLLTALLSVTGVLIILRQGSQRRLWVVFAALALPAIVTGAAAWTKWDHDYRNPPAFVSPAQAVMRSGPGTHFEETGTLPSGTQVEPVRRSGIWTEIRLATGKRAWVEEHSLARPPEPSKGSSP